MTRITRSKRVKEVVDLSHTSTVELSFDYDDGELQEVKGAYRLYYGDEIGEYEYKSVRVTDEEVLEEFQTHEIGWVEEKMLQRAIDKVKVNNSQ